jgi:hypothetical protein
VCQEVARITSRTCSRSLGCRRCWTGPFYCTIGRSSEDESWHQKYTTHMCTIEDHEELCKDTREAASVFMGPAERPWGRGKRVSTSPGEHRKKSARAAPHGAGVRGNAQYPHVAPRPARFGDLRQQRPQGWQTVHTTRHRAAWRGRAKPASGRHTPLRAPLADLWRQPEASWPQRGNTLRRLGRATAPCS